MGRPHTIPGRLLGPLSPPSSPVHPLSMCLVVLSFFLHCSFFLLITHSHTAAAAAATPSPPSAPSAPSTPDLAFFMQGHFSNNHTFPSAPLIGYMSNETASGVLAAFHTANTAGGIAGGRRLSLKLFDDKGYPEVWGPAGNTTAAMSDPAVLGAVAAKVLESFYVNPIARQLRMPVFGPTTIDQAELSKETPGSDFLIHVQLPLLSDGLAGLNFAMKGSMHCRTFLVVYMDAFGIKATADRLLHEISRLGFADTVVYAASFQLYSQPYVIAREVVDKFLAATTRPTCALLMLDAAVILPVVTTLSTSIPATDFDDLHFFATTVGTLPKWVARYTGSSAPFRNVYVSSSLPAGTDRRFDFIRSFQGAMAALAQSGTSPFVAHALPNAFAVSGYMAGRMVIETVSRIGIGTTITRQSLKEAVYRTRSFLIDDVALGPYSNGCRGQQTDATGACWCTSGMKRLFFSRVNGTTGAPAAVFDPPHFPGIAELQIPMSRCGVDAAETLQRPFIAVAPTDTTLTSSTDSNLDFTSLVVGAFRETVLAAHNARKLPHGPVFAVPYSTKVNTTFTSTNLRTLATRYNLVFLVAALYDPAKVYPRQLSNSAPSSLTTMAETQATGTVYAVDGALRGMATRSITSQSATTTLPKPSSTAAHVLDIAPLSAVFMDRDDKWRPPHEHFPLRVPFYPTLADFAMAAAAFAVSRDVDAMTVVADSERLSDLAVRSVETHSRRPPVHAATLPADGSTAMVTEALVRATTATKLTGAEVPFVLVVSRRTQVIDTTFQSAKLEGNAAVSFVIATDEFVLEKVLATVPSSAVPSNVFFVSGLPQYRASNQTSSTAPLSAAASYSAAVADTVLALYDLAPSANASSVQIATAAYRSATVSVHTAGGTVSIGPLWAAGCSAVAAPTWPHPGGECQCAKGLGTFYVHSVLSVSNNERNTPPLFSFRHAGCGPAYRPLDSPAVASPLSTVEIVFTAAAGVVLVVVVATTSGLVWVLCCRRSTRDNTNAPTDPSEPFTIAFTDIQASTRLWARAPDCMAEALDAHHSLLRHAVKKHKGYEVKTIGDSFMVAFKTPSSALRFAFDVQTSLYSHDFNTELFDDVYRDAAAELLMNADDAEAPPVVELLSAHSRQQTMSAVHSNDICDISNTSATSGARRHDDDQPSAPHASWPMWQEPAAGGRSGSQPTSPGLGRVSDASQVAYAKYAAPEAFVSAPCDDSGTYGALWSGLRVRVGVHHGTGNIRLDETTQGYDYYGTVVNTAARVEGVGHGGQVLMTEAVYECLGDAAIAELRGDVVDLGPQPLRGLPEPVRLFQALPVAFSARTFPALRLDVEKEADDGSTTGKSTNDQGDDDGSRTKRSSDLGESYDVMADLTKRLRFDRQGAVTAVTIAATFDAISTLFAAVKPAARKDAMKALSSAWRVNDVWSARHLKKLDTSLGLPPQRASLLAAVGRAVKAMEAQSRDKNTHVRRKGTTLARDSIFGSSSARISFMMTSADDAGEDRPRRRSTGGPARPPVAPADGLTTPGAGHAALMHLVTAAVATADRPVLSVEASPKMPRGQRPSGGTSPSFAAAPCETAHGAMSRTSSQLSPDH